MALTPAEPAGHPPAADDAAVVALVNRAVAERDAAAFGALYDRFVDRVYRYLYVRIGQHAEAEDLTEQVFLKAWEAIGRYRWQGRPVPGLAVPPGPQHPHRPGAAPAPDHVAHR